MKTTLKCFLYIHIFIINLYSQQPNFFPLQIGNEYQFKGRYQQEYYFGTIEKDTIYPNSQKYYTLPDRVFEFGNTRVDSNGNILSVSKRFFGGDPEEQVLFKSDAVLDEVWPVAWNFNPVIDTGYAKCIYVDSGYIFDKMRSIKGVLIFDYSYYYYYFWVAEGIGLVRTQYDDGSGLDINYAKIDGKMYGTLVSVEEEMPLLSSEFNVSQNYPNPFNPSTKIKYSLNQYGYVSLKVYDVLGKEVATLVNEDKSVGNYEVSFNASNLASGIYYYQFRAGEFVETKKMILLK